jgi:hypothetical protein
LQDPTFFAAVAGTENPPDNLANKYPKLCRHDCTHGYQARRLRLRRLARAQDSRNDHSIQGQANCRTQLLYSSTTTAVSALCTAKSPRMPRRRFKRRMPSKGNIQHHMVSKFCTITLTTVDFQTHRFHARPSLRGSFYGVNALFQNGMAQRHIRELQDHTRTMPIHASKRWPSAIHIHLRPSERLSVWQTTP